MLHERLRIDLSKNTLQVNKLLHKLLQLQELILTALRQARRGR